MKALRLSCNLPLQVFHDWLSAGGLRVRGGAHLPDVGGHLLWHRERLLAGTDYELLAGRSLAE